MARGRRFQISNRPLTKPREPNRFGDLGQVLLAVLLLVVPCFFWASYHARLQQTRRTIAQLEQRLVQLEEERQRLVLEQSMNLDPRRIEERARRVSGLVSPDPSQVLYLSRPGAPFGGARPLLAEDTGGGDGHP